MVVVVVVVATVEEVEVVEAVEEVELVEAVDPAVEVTEDKLTVIIPWDDFTIFVHFKNGLFLAIINDLLIIVYKLNI